MSTFSGLTNALRAINAQQYGLAVTGDNMANANTPGYTRKRADLMEVGVVVGVPRISATANSDAGTVTADTASRLNDPVLDARARVEHGQNAYAETNQSTLSNVETVFNEPSDNGLARQLDTFSASWSNLANQGPTNVALRTSVLSAGANVASALNAAAAELTTQRASATSDLASTVSQINAAASQVATLNLKIKGGTASGEDVNQLSDTRDAVLVRLSELAGTTSSLAADGTATVTMPPGASATLVTGVAPATPLVLSASPPFSLTVGATTVGTTTGHLQGVLDAVNTTIPSYQTKLDAMAATLAAGVNNGQLAGYDQGTPPVAGAQFYTAGPAAATATTAANVTAANITLGFSDTSLIAASATTPAPTVPDKNGGNAAAIALIGKSSTGVDSLYRNLITTLGNASQQATQAAAVQLSVTNTVDNLQQSASGVNYDEETTNILIFQRAYQASSRVLTTVDAMLDQLINHTGRVGL